MKSSELSERRGTPSPTRFLSFIFPKVFLDFSSEIHLFFFFFFLSHQLHEYRTELDTSLPPPLDTVAGWLLKTEGALAEDEAEAQDHGRAADAAKEKQQLLKVSFYSLQQEQRMRLDMTLCT